MISQAKKNGQRVMMVGLLLALVCSFLTYSAIQSAQPPKPVVKHQPIVMVGKHISANSSMKSVIYGEDGGTGETTKEICPNPELPSLPVGSLLICLISEEEVASSTGLKLDLVSEDQLKQDNPQGRHKVMSLIIFELLQQVGNTYTTVDLPSGAALQTSVLQDYPTIGKNMRAVAIPVNAVSNVGNRVGQGDHVDIVATYLTKVNDDALPVTKVLFQNVEVLGASDNETFAERISSQDRFGASKIESTSIVTVRMSPVDATHLIHMSAIAQDLRLVLREIDDSELVDIQPVMSNGTE